MAEKSHSFVDSSTIARIAYESDNSTLVVEFLSGRQYRYFDVEAAHFDELIAAPSAGKYFNANILKKYKFERLK